MIINIRGTSGSGKSTLVRQVLQHYIGAGNKAEYHKSGRKQPLYTVYHRFMGRSLFVPGHYNSACGGCDTISSYEEIYDLVREGHNRNCDVIYEGLLISGEAARPIKLFEDGFPLTVFALTTPIDKCIENINTRRWSKDPEKPPVKEKNTRAKARAVELAMVRMQAAGIDAQWRDFDGAFQEIKTILGV